MAQFGYPLFDYDLIFVDKTNICLAKIIKEDDKEVLAQGFSQSGFDDNKPMVKWLIGLNDTEFQV